MYCTRCWPFRCYWCHCIARCFTYGGKKKRPLYGANTENIVRKISKDDYMKAGRNAPTIDHFYEKLLLLKDMMKTNGGKKLQINAMISWWRICNNLVMKWMVYVRLCMCVYILKIKESSERTNGIIHDVLV